MRAIRLDSRLRGKDGKGALLALLLLLLPLPALAQGPTLFAGAWTSGLGVDTQTEDPLEDMAVLQNRLDLDLRHPLADDVRVRLAARLHHRASVGHRGDHEPAFEADWPAFGTRLDHFAELREAYVQWDTRLGSLTVGRDVVQWGALELQSPLRIVNPVDYSGGLLAALGGDETTALPDFMLRWQRRLGPGTAEVVWQPFFEQHRYSPFATDAAFVRPGFGPEVPMQAALRRIDLRLDRTLSDALMMALAPPDAAPWDGSLAARYALRLGDWDVAAAAIFNWDRLPELRFDEDIALVLGRFAAAGFDQSAQIQVFADPEVQAASARLDGSGKTLADLVRADWQRRLTLGLSASGELVEGLVLRADLAHAPQVGRALGRVFFDQQFAPIVSAFSQAGVGLEYTHEDTLAVLLEGTYQHVHDVPPGRDVFLLARHHVVLAGGGLYRLGETQQWTLQLGGMLGASLGDWAVLPRVSWEPTENWRLGLAAALLGGPADSPGGLFGTDDQVLLDVRRAF